MTQKRLLLIDVDVSTLTPLKLFLEEEGFEITTVNNGLEALSMLKNNTCFDMVLLNIILPDIDGWEICKKINQINAIPFIILTEKYDVFNIVFGLELGADDYIAKPFETREVHARIKAVLRRYKKNTKIEHSKSVEVSNVLINLEKYELFINDKLIKIPPKELELLYHLMSHPNKVFTRDNLLDDIWGFEYYGDSRTVDVHIKRIREKLENVDGKKNWSLRTIWGVGYKFEVLDY